MTRSRKSARNAGTAHETNIARYLATEMRDDRIERRARNGQNDRGDISGIRSAFGDRVVVECKDYGGRLLPAQWVAEARAEAGNDDAPVGVVIAKRRGVTDAARQYVLMELSDLVVLLVGTGEGER